MTLQNITSTLKDRLKAYSNTEVYKINDSPKEISDGILKSIEIALEAERNSTKITEKDKRWFPSIGIVSKCFDDPEWWDIGKLYYDFFNLVKELYF